MISALQSLIQKLEQDNSLDEPNRLRERLEALDLLDSYPLDSYPLDSYPLDTYPLDTYPSDSQSSALNPIETSLDHRATAIHARLEAANLKLYQTIREEIRQGAGQAAGQDPGQDTLLQWTLKSGHVEDAINPSAGQSYDYLDELVSGVLQFTAPDVPAIQSAPETVFYQPTPARHIFDLIGRAELNEHDVLIDLGSGLGHVPLLASICRNTRSIGIEMEAAYINCARQSASALNLTNVTFIQQDAREADLSRGTVFYLYTPFFGTILRTVLDSLHQQARSRKIRICTFGPCTPTVAKEPWLKPNRKPETDRITIFHSGN
jgi:hypothetical protein